MVGISVTFRGPSARVMKHTHRRTAGVDAATATYRVLDDQWLLRASAVRSVENSGSPNSDIQNKETP